MDPVNALHYVTKRDEDTCENSSDYDGRDNLRVLALFIILISSSLGSFFPILSSRYSFIRLPNWCFFIAKFFGSGVIVATGFIHLLEPANDALTNPCLTGTFEDYPWAFGICLMSLYVLFLVEIVTHFFVAKVSAKEDVEVEDKEFKANDEESSIIEQEEVRRTEKISSIPGEDHYGHDNVHQDLAQANTLAASKQKEKYLNQIVSVFILEFGVIFHSVFIGLSLAVSGDEFITLFIVLVFHQMFEGLGLGTRIAETNWEAKRWYTPWLLALGYSLSTPIAIAIGLGVRHSFSPNSRKALISNGCFDAISAGILIYTGLVELMAHEFLYSNQFKGENGFRRMIFAFIIMAAGSVLMALLGKWA